MEPGPEEGGEDIFGMPEICERYIDGMGICGGKVEPDEGICGGKVEPDEGFMVCDNCYASYGPTQPPGEINE